MNLAGIVSITSDHEILPPSHWEEQGNATKRQGFGLVQVIFIRLGALNLLEKTSMMNIEKKLIRVVI